MCVSIITINYNTGDKTVQLLNSIKKFIKLPYEVIVVDNASKKHDYDKLKTYCDQQEGIKLIRNKFNSGFGAGNMLGCNYAKHPYLAFINNDVVMLEDTLSALKKFMDQHENVAAVSPQQLDESGKRVKSFDYFHGLRKTLLGRWSVEMFKDKSLRRSNRTFDQPIEVDFIQGSFMFIRADAFYKCGGFDTNIFLYYEEMDICYRLKKLGYQRYFYPDSRFQHESGGSTEPGFAIKTEPKLSYLYLIRKHHNYTKYLILKYYLLLVFVLKGLKDYHYFSLAWDIWSEKILQRSLKQHQ